MEYQHIKEIIKKYEEGQADAAERAMLESWYIKRLRQNADLVYPDDLPERMGQALAMILAIDQLVPVPDAVRKIKLWPRIAVAAAAVASMVFGVWFYYAANTPRHPESNPEFSSGSGSPLANDIGPGKNKATLTLSDGKTLTLSDAKTGVIVDAAKLIYNDGSAVERGDSDLNEKDGENVQTITTPRGGTYQITLADGTKVWLNAASSLTYSGTLNKPGLRRVKLEGEGYFEVAHNASRPFIVSVGRKEVTVLGTHFNVNGYEEETDTKVTLLQGSVKVTTGGLSKLIKPGEQARMANSADAGIIINKIAVKQATDWKNDEFIFAGEPLAVIMRKISRWYDVEVVYQNEALKNEVFVGSISRFASVSKVLDMLKLTKTVNFKIEPANGQKGRRIVVMK